MRARSDRAARPVLGPFAPAVLLALLAGCATGGSLRERARAIDGDVQLARKQRADQCAPRELAVAEANLRFADLELSQGDSIRAGEHLDLAQAVARKAFEASANCGPVLVVIREKEKPAIALKDTDGDGVPDVDDLCPDVPGPASNHGCPLLADRDGDGITDDIDRCPDLPGPKENFGCPWPDRDHDGVPDKDDRCPDEPGPKENQGCPRAMSLIVVRRDRIELKQQVHFLPNRARILNDSHELLRQVAQAMKDVSSVSVRVEGHTDNVGKLAHNLKLSQGRAEEVRRFLVQQGVDPQHLVAEGFGPTRPIASNATRAGKRANRRVEFRMVDASAGKISGAEK